MDQVFPDIQLNSAEFLAGEPLKATFGKFHRHLTVRYRNAEVILECRGRKKETASLICEYGDINLVAHCLATGVDTDEDMEYDVHRVVHHHQKVTREINQSGRRIEFSRNDEDRISLVVRGRGVPGGLIRVSCERQHALKVASRLATGSYV